VHSLGVGGRTLPELGRVAAVVAAGDQLVLEAVDARHEARDQRRRVAADLVAAQGEVVHAVEHQRDPVGRRHRGEERIESGLDRLLVQDPLAEPVERGHAQLLERRRDARLETAAHGVGGLRGEGERQDRVRRRAVLGEPLEARQQHARLPGPGTPDHEQRTPGVPRSLELCFREAAGGGRHRA
jgi:hypothetical protein